MFRLVLPCAKGLEQLLLEEAQSLGLLEAKMGIAYVKGLATQKTAYRLCLWSRLASRVLLNVVEASVDSPEAIYQVVRSVDWTAHLSVDATFAVRFNGTGQGIRNTQFGALRVKDAVVDCLRDYYQKRPDVDAKNPDLLIDARLHKGVLSVSIDISGGALHERGYRQAQGHAPLKENLAAALLYRSRWHENWQNYASIIDPMCGAGTLLIEALMMATDTAPAIARKYFAFLNWQEHRPKLWHDLKNEALERHKEGLLKCNLKAYGFDQDPQILKIARQNALVAGFAHKIHFEKRDLKDFEWQSAYGDAGLIVSNPPYGERLGEAKDLIALYQDLGFAFKSFPNDWQMTVISSNNALLQRMKLKSARQYQVFNGALESKIALYQRASQDEVQQKKAEQEKKCSPAAEMFANRLHKNQQKLKKWAQKIPCNAYRIYDRDLPEYAFAIDLYADYVLLQEYAAPKEINTEKARTRLYDAIQVLQQTLNLKSHQLILKTRERQLGNKQYEKIGEKAEKIIITEGKAQFLVNLHDYLDTGLFLDHRPMRLRLAKESKDKRVLNLFCYTATASVHAALGGASYTTSVDLSNTYLEWAQENFALNHLDSKHRLVRGDVMQWLKNGNDTYDIIFCDPPTFSNTKKENRVFDVQRDHVALIDAAMRRLVSRGTLYFSNNFRRFRLDETLSERYLIEEISAQTIDKDFARNPKIHRTWKIKHKQSNDAQ